MSFCACESNWERMTPVKVEVEWVLQSYSEMQREQRDGGWRKEEDGARAGGLEVTLMEYHSTFKWWGSRSSAMWLHKSEVHKQAPSAPPPLMVIHIQTANHNSQCFTQHHLPDESSWSPIRWVTVHANNHNNKIMIDDENILVLSFSVAHMSQVLTTGGKKDTNLTWLNDKIDVVPSCRTTWPDHIDSYSSYMMTNISPQITCLFDLNQFLFLSRWRSRVMSCIVTDIFQFMWSYTSYHTETSWMFTWTPSKMLQTDHNIGVIAGAHFSEPWHISHGL